MTPSPEVAAHLRRWQGVTLGTLFVGYMGYYVCRSNLSVATPLLLAEYKDAGLTKANIGDIASFGVLFYAIGKTLNGILTEYLGGRYMFLLGMLISAICTVLFAMTPYFSKPLEPLAHTLELPLAILLPMFAVWAVNRFVQSMGWNGLVQISAWWFDSRRIATVMGFLCMSYLLGDAIARAYLGEAIKLGLGWQGLFLLSAGTLFVIAAFSAILLKGRPSQIGLPEPPPPPGNVYGHHHADQKVPLGQLLAPLLMNFTFWLVCLLNMGLTLIRETFTFWTPTYLNEVAHIDAANAGITSLFFPLSGAVASVFCGWLVDRLGGRYGPVVIGSLLLLVGSLAAMAYVPADDDPVLAVVLICGVAFAMMGPYSFCSGVLAVKLGGQRGGATAAGIVDSAGYFGATLAGSGIGRVAKEYGWENAFLSLAGVAVLTFLVAAVYALRGEKRT